MPQDIDIEKHIESVILGMGKMVDQQWTAINLLIEARLIGPALIQIYAAIDIMASLNLDSPNKYVKRSDFKDWVNHYLLPNSELNCTADDLYGARCGLLHSYSSESTSMHKGEATAIWYAWGDADENTMQQLADASKQSIVVIHIGKLFDALRKGAASFLADTMGNKEKMMNVYMRAQKLRVPLEEGDAQKAFDTHFGAHS